VVSGLRTFRHELWASDAFDEDSQLAGTPFNKDMELERKNEKTMSLEVMRDDLLRMSKLMPNSGLESRGNLRLTSTASVEASCFHEVKLSLQIMLSDLAEKRVTLSKLGFPFRRPFKLLWKIHLRCCFLTLPRNLRICW